MPPDAAGRQSYNPMLVDGIAHLRCNFFWEWSATEYQSCLLKRLGAGRAAFAAPRWPPWGAAAAVC